MSKLDGRTVLVTGGSRGQGEQEARLFAAEGAQVVIADVLDDLGEELAKELAQRHGEGRVRYQHLDVGSEADWEAAVGATVSAFGKLDGLVNNAGILRFNELVSTPLEEYLAVVRVNQVGCFLGMRAAAPLIEAAGGGTIVNTASYTALTGMALLTSYAATKGAILSMTRVASMELASKGIRVNAICPGAVDTPPADERRGRGGDGGRGGAAVREGRAAGPGGPPRGDSAAGALPHQRRLLLCDRSADRGGRRLDVGCLHRLAGADHLLTALRRSARVGPV
jgi:3alpha(or 20beta)-hydroxysteroid dehydrogenase